MGLPYRLEGFREGRFRSAAVFLELFHGAGSDAAAGGVDDSLQAQPVSGVGGGFQVGRQFLQGFAVAGFVRVRGAAFEAVSPAGFDDGACLAIGADEDGALAGGYALFPGQAEGFEDDGFGFLAWVPVFFAGDGGSGLPAWVKLGLLFSGFRRMISLAPFRMLAVER